MFWPVAWNRFVPLLPLLHFLTSTLFLKTDATWRCWYTLLLYLLLRIVASRLFLHTSLVDGWTFFFCLRSFVHTSSLLDLFFTTLLLLDINTTYYEKLSKRRKNRLVHEMSI
jgi:hypothetical protein